MRRTRNDVNSASVLLALTGPPHGDAALALGGSDVWDLAADMAVKVVRAARRISGEHRALCPCEWCELAAETRSVIVP